MPTTTTDYRLWRDRRYLTWLGSDTSAGLSAALSGFAIPLIALAVTGSPAQAGVIGAVSLIVRLIATLGGGVLADRRDRFALMVTGALLGLAIALAFLVLAALDALNFTTLLFASALLSVRAGAFGVAGETAIKQIVPSASMGRAQAANQGRDAALNLAGGPLGGVLLAAGGWAVAAAMTACQVVALATAALLRRRPAAVPAGDTAEEPASADAWTQLREGFVWLFRRPDLRAVLLISTVVNLGFTTGMTTIIYALQVSGHSPQQIGMVSAIASVAMLAGAALSPVLITRVRAGVLTAAGLTLSTAGIVALGQIESYPAIVAILSVSVIGIPALNAALIGYLTVATPSRLLGRVSSASSVMAMGAMPLAPLIAGFGLDGIGRPATMALAGAICAVAVVMTFTSRGLRGFPTEAGWAEHAARFAETRA